MYLGLMAFQLGLAFVMPGKVQKGPFHVSPGAPSLVPTDPVPAPFFSPGLPVPSLDYKTLSYRCNALSSFYVTLLASATLHLTGLFDLTNIIDHFGPLMSVAMIVGFALSIAVYVGGVFFHWGGQPIRMSGWVVYDFFMGGQSSACVCSCHSLSGLTLGSVWAVHLQLLSTRRSATST